MGWSDKPKVWTSRGHAVASLLSGMKNYHHSSVDGVQKYQAPPEEWELLEVSLDTDSTKGTSCKSIIDGRNRSVVLQEKYGLAFAAMVDTIEKKEENDVWQWVLCVGGGRHTDAIEQMTGILQNHKLKKNKDYRMVTREKYGAFAFKDKAQASMVRLTFRGECNGVDIKEYVEIDNPASVC